MELFKFIPDGTDDGYLKQGEFLNGIKTATWVEKFKEPGDFTITAPISSGLRDTLDLGTIISHTDTLEAAMVENIEIDEEVDEGEPNVVITGRTLDAWLEQRVVGEDIEHYGTLILTYFPYALEFDTSWIQAKELIRLHTNDMSGILTGNIEGIVPIDNQQHIGSSTAADRSMGPRTLHEGVMELLDIDDFGIKVVRPNADNIDPLVAEFRIHNGVDRSAYIIFSHVQGDLQSAKYLWSIKSLKTDYFLASTFMVGRSDSASTGFNRRTMFVDCSDIDQAYTADDLADGPIMAALGAAMYARGEAALKANKVTSILSTNISKTTRYKFRQDYEVGDLVTVRGNYNVNSIMRVTEHVEFQDETGESGYPTLSIYDPAEDA